MSRFAGCFICGLLLAVAVAAAPFTYQGYLEVGGLAATGAHDFVVEPYSDANGVTPYGPGVQVNDVSVTKGRFTVLLNLGDAIAGGGRWLQISVRPSGTTDGFVQVGPRQQITAAPLSAFAYTVPWSGVTGAPTYTASGGLTLNGTNFTLDTAYTDSRYLRKDTPGGQVQVLGGSLNLTSHGNFIHPNIAYGNWGGIAAHVFSTSNYFGPDATAPIYIGESNPVHVRGGLHTPVLYDRDNTAYYVDPAGTSVLNDVRANIVYDRNNTNYYVDPAGVSVVSELRATRFVDSANTGFSVMPSGTSVMNDVRASIVYDRNDPNYYVDPAGTSVVKDVTASTVTASNLVLNGNLARPAGSPNLPIAYGTFGSDAAVQSGTAGITCAWSAANTRYEVTLPGYTYISSSYVAAVTPIGATPLIATTGSVGGKVLIYLTTLAGAKTQGSFHLTVYKP